MDPSRLVFAPRVPPPAHLARHVHADLFLDTFRCNAHTTAADALWMGLPVLTCPGETFVSRVAGSMLQAIALPELIARGEDDYLALAIELATNPALLAEYRTRIADNRLTTPLFDMAQFTRAMEHTFEGMWHRWRSA
jgi:predicted O-linked N-acetylglucosamine transferase (SPINDLY family)